ncbi:MAG TPA: carbon-nitrogen hydrolase family protein [Thermoleophilaceae bacterium]
MQVTLAQLMPRSRALPDNLARARELLAASAESDLVVLPELFLSGYQLEDVEPLAIELDGPEVGALRDAARSAGTALLVGAAERVGGGIANSAICIDRAGELAGVYRKTHLFGAERDAYLPGDSLSTIALDGRTLGVMICFDMEFPEVARTLAGNDADLLVTLSANPSQFALDHDLFARARALENGLPHVYVNRVGDESGFSFDGGSLAVDPDAAALAELGPTAERVVTVELGEPGRRDERTRYRELLRDELYRGSIPR